MRLISPSLRSSARRRAWSAAGLALVLPLVWHFRTPPSAQAPALLVPKDYGDAGRQLAGPPWLYGSADARFTVIGYADLECPHCRAYWS